jgi:ASC-1-like (ASCH) protein
MANYHLAILKRHYIDMILDGSKTVESRFTITKRAPFGQIFEGDELFLKQSSGPVCAMAKVRQIKTFENLTQKKILKIKQLYNEDILASDEYWQSKLDCRFGILIQLKDVRTIEPIHISKKDWRAWVVLTEKSNFGLLA